MSAVTVASDTLTTGGTSDLSGRTADFGGTWDEALNDSTVKGVVDGTVSAARASGTDNSNKMFYALGAPTTPDYEIEVTVQALSGGDDPIGIMGRYQNASNFYFLRENGRMIRYTAGVFTQIFIMSTIPAAGNAIKLRFSGTTIEAFLDTGAGFVSKGSVVDTDHSAKGRTGLAWGSIYFATHDIVPRGELTGYRVSQDGELTPPGGFRPIIMVST